MASPRDFGIQSFCFRNFKDNREVATMVTDLGLDKIELCKIHADFDDPSCFDDVIGIYRDAGIQIVSGGVEYYNGDEDTARLRCEFAKKAGAKFLSAHVGVGDFQDGLATMQKLGEEYDLRFGLHCHGGYMFGGSYDVMKHLLETSGDRVGLNIDTAWCIQTGRRNNPIDWANDFADKHVGIHYKDFTFNPDNTWQDVIVGEGCLDLPGFIQATEANNFDGYAVIEYEADRDNPMPALKKCVAAMKAAMPA